MSKPKKRGKRKVGRPRGGKYPAAMRKVWRDYQRQQRAKKKRSKKK